MNIPLFHTYVSPDAPRQITAVLNSTYLSEGHVVKSFEGRLATDLGLLHPLALNSGTSALHLALVLAGVREGDEVILPAQTFVASGLAVLYVNAKPVFADIEYDTGNLDVASVKSKITARTKAIIPVHWGGLPCDMDAINGLASSAGIAVIEDAAHALGASYRGRPIGSLSDFTCFSFQAIKHLTTGDGGAVCIKDQSLVQRGLALRWFGIDRSASPVNTLGERTYNLDEIGYKYHMNNYAAALGLANLEGYTERLKQRLEIANYYRKNLQGLDGVRLFREFDDRVSAYWLFGMHVERRDAFIAAMKGRNIEVSVVHQRIDRNRIFGSVRTTLTVQEEFDRTQIHIPIHDNIDMPKAQYIVDAIRHGW